MKRSVLIGLVFILALPCFALAGEIDGIWWSPVLGLNGPSSGVFMVRENSGTVIVASLSLGSFGDGYDYCALIGTQIGNIVPLLDSPYCAVSINATMTLTSPTSGIMRINFCQPKFAFSECIIPSEVNLEVQKIF